LGEEINTHPSPVTGRDATTGGDEQGTVGLIREKGGSGSVVAVERSERGQRDPIPPDRRNWTMGYLAGR
jgi:hypothetical protein